VIDWQMQTFEIAKQQLKQTTRQALCDVLTHGYEQLRDLVPPGALGDGLILMWATDFHRLRQGGPPTLRRGGDGTVLTHAYALIRAVNHCQLVNCHICERHRRELERILVEAL
jgi:hypothetical protein